VNAQCQVIEVVRTGAYSKGRVFANFFYEKAFEVVADSFCHVKSRWIIRKGTVVDLGS
jgi:hypothetical protein